MNFLFPSDKKGIFLPMLLLFTILLLGTAIYFFAVQAPKNIPQTLGEEHTVLMASYLDAEKDVYALDQIAKYSLEKAVKDINNNGGIFYTSSCVAVANNLILFSTNDCIITEETLLQNLEHYFRNHFDSHLFTSPIELTADDYEFTFVDKEGTLTVTGKAKKGTEYTTTFSVYKLPLHFKATIPYTLDYYRHAFRTLAQHKKCIRSTPYNELTDTKTKIPETCGFDQPGSWQLVKDREILFVTVTIDHQLLFVKDIDTQFAINLNSLDKTTLFNKQFSSRSQPEDILL